MYQIKIQNTVEKQYFDEENNEVVERDAAVVAQEESNLLQVEADKTQVKVDTYKATQENQKNNGGPGPVADFVTMKIVNEHNGQFEVVFEEEN